MQMREMTKEQIVLQKRAGENMKEYEVIWEIFNKCPRNQMRDVFVDEVEIEDPEEYIKNKFIFVHSRTSDTHHSG